jgi:hypothetical protein
MLFDFLFGCTHRRTTFPLTEKRRPERVPRTYVVCLHCGREFEYSWDEMQILPHQKPSAPVEEEYRVQ